MHFRAPSMVNNTRKACCGGLDKLDLPFFLQPFFGGQAGSCAIMHAHTKRVLVSALFCCYIQLLHLQAPPWLACQMPIWRLLS